MSPAWYESGHQVCQCRVVLTNVNSEQDAPGAVPRCSQGLASARGNAWSDQTKEVMALLSSALRVMNPGQYHAMRRVHDTITRANHCVDSLQRWAATAFSAVSIISNRRTPFHRDPQTYLRCYDLLVSVGEYQNAPIVLDGLNIQIQNNPGTIVAVPGKTIRHGVPRCAGPRVCYALYARESLFKRFKVRLPPWMEQDIYSDCLGPVNRSNVRGLPPRYPIM